uniref:hypothetical protein n=1 Tax=Bacillus velezensis TaxID=492670 RepID=UPI0016437BD8
LCLMRVGRRRLDRGIENGKRMVGKKRVGIGGMEGRRVGGVRRINDESKRMWVGKGGENKGRKGERDGKAKRGSVVMVGGGGLILFW